MITLVAAALLQAGALPLPPHYDDLPQPAARDVRACAAAYDRAEYFVTRFKTAVHRRELDHGGRLTWSQGNSIRYAADVAIRPYLERIRHIAFRGEATQCRALADEGIAKVTNEILLPLFGRR